MDRKKETNLKYLNWNDILHKQSDDEYDSDETCCDLDISIIGDGKEGLDYTEKNRKEHINHTTNSKKEISLFPPEKRISNNYATLDVKIEQNNQQLTNKSANYLTDKESFNTVHLNSLDQSILSGKEIPKISDAEENNNHTHIADSSTLQCTQHERKQYSTCTTDKPVRCYRKYPKVISKKSLPKRKCNSTFINNYHRSDTEDKYDGLSETKDNEIIDSTKFIANNTVPTSNSENGTNKEGKTGLTKKTNKRRGRKRKNINDTSSTVADLEGIDVELNVIEDRVERWITGKDGEPPSRQQAFQMLAESQNFVKLLNMRRQKHFTQYCPKNEKQTVKLLLKRANIVSTVIDKAIAEADRLMLEETANFDCEQIIEDDLEVTDLKSILKNTSSDDSKESNDSNNKRVSFSDDVDYHYFSGSENGSVNVINNTSEELITNDQFRNRQDLKSWTSTCKDKTKEKSSCKQENTNKGFKKLKYVASEQILPEEKYDRIDEEKNNVLNKRNYCSNITTCNKLFINSKPEIHQVFNSEDKTMRETVSEKNANTSNIYSQDLCSSKYEDNLKDASTEIVSEETLIDDYMISVEHQNYNQIKGIRKDRLIDKETTTNSECCLRTTQQISTDNEDAIQSETSAVDENSFGFSNVEKESDEMAWNNITIMSIKSVRIRGDDEYVRLADASFSADDFKW